MNIGSHLTKRALLNPGLEALVDETAGVRFNFGEDFQAGATQFVRMNLATSKAFITEGVRRMAASVPSE